MTTTIPKIAVNEFVAAEAIGKSVHFLRKDRQNYRRIPFFKVGRAVFYNLDRVREALAEMEQGGPAAPACKVKPKTQPAPSTGNVPSCYGS